jgi:fructose-1,6-bisphosphatase
MKTLHQFLHDERQLPAREGADLARVIEAIAAECVTIADTIARGALAGALGEAGSINVQGESQKKLDVIAHETMLRAAKAAGSVAALASEEADTIVPIGDPAGLARYLLLVDPLDGSSNLDCNVTVGTIFSVLPRKGTAEVTERDFLQKGRAQLAAGYVLYGPSTMLVLTVGRGTHGFTLERGELPGGRRPQFVLTHPSLKVAETTREYAVNTANARFWEPPVARYVREVQAGREGARGADFNTRWVASLVVDAQRILSRGGIYLYPKDARYTGGRLRLMYEANPIGWLIEQAGGRVSTGRESLLDVVPQNLHQKTPLLFGAAQEVVRLMRYHAEHDQGLAEEYTSPLFGKRELFAV